MDMIAKISSSGLLTMILVAFLVKLVKGKAGKA